MENNNQDKKELAPVQTTKRLHARPRPAKKSPAQEQAPKRNKPVYQRRRPSRNLPARSGRGAGSYKPSIGEKLVSALSSIISRSFKTIIPWTILSVLVFTYGAYAIFYTITLDPTLPLWYVLLLAFILFGFFGIFGLCYGVAMALLFTVKYFSESVGALVRESINRIKNSIESKVDNFAESLSKNEVMDIIRSTFEDLHKNIKRYAANTAAGLIALSALAGIIFITKNTLIKSAKSIKNKADFFTMLSAKTALVAAVILNLSFFAKLAIYLGYILGLIVVLAQIIIVLLLK